jgi:hypothetical protein
VGTSAGLRGLIGAALIVLVATGCAGGAYDPVPTPCGGSHDWPPNDYPAVPPAGVTVTPLSEFAARISNRTDTTWWVRASVWGEGGCTGWVTFMPDVSDAVPPGEDRVVTVADPSSPDMPYRLAIEFREEPCDYCLDLPAGFWSDDVRSPAAPG